jgi:hypothetical protein
LESISPLVGHAGIRAQELAALTTHPDTDSIVSERLHNQHVWGRKLASPVGVVGWLGAMQSQEYAYARWSVTQRTTNASAEAVDRAFAEGSILRLHVIRPTWHFVSAKDVRWILKVSAPRVHALNAYYYRQLAVDAKLANRAVKLFAKALEGGRQLTRPEMALALKRAGINAEGVKLGYLLIHAELEGVICSGALKGRLHTYALLDDRAPKTKELHRDEALAKLTRLYFTSRGPATLKDFATWSSLTTTEARKGLEAVKHQLDTASIDGRTYWFAAAGSAPRPKAPVVDLLQGYDEYVMSYSESRDVMFQPAPQNLRPLDRTSYYHALLLDGRLVGHWRHQLEKGKAVIQMQISRTLNAQERIALDTAVARYAAFLSMPTTADA